MTTSETSRSSGPGGPLARTVVDALAWHTVLFAAAFGLPRGLPPRSRTSAPRSST